MTIFRWFIALFLRCLYLVLFIVLRLACAIHKATKKLKWVVNCKKKEKKRWKAAATSIYYICWFNKSHSFKSNIVFRLFWIEWCYCDTVSIFSCCVYIFQCMHFKFSKWNDLCSSYQWYEYELRTIYIQLQSYVDVFE